MPPQDTSEKYLSVQMKLHCQHSLVIKVTLLNMKVNLDNRLMKTYTLNSANMLEAELDNETRGRNKMHLTE